MSNTTVIEIIYGTKAQKATYLIVERDDDGNGVWLWISDKPLTAKDREKRRVPGNLLADLSKTPDGTCICYIPSVCESDAPKMKIIAHDPNKPCWYQLDENGHRKHKQKKERA